MQTDVTLKNGIALFRTHENIHIYSILKSYSDSADAESYNWW